MKKQNEVRYIVTDVASIPVFRLASKTEAYRQAVKPGWGTVEWYSAADGYKNPVSRDRSDKTQQLVCDEDSSADLYTKNGGYFGISPYEEISTKEMPKQAACAAIIHSDSCGFDFWTEDGQIRIFVTYDVNGLIDSYRLEYGADVQPYDGETEIRFEDLYERAEEDHRETYRAEIPGTVEYQHKQEAAEVAAQAAATAGQKETWMDEAQQEQFRQICRMIDTIKSGRDFYHIINKINNNYELDVINAAREYKKCFNSAQYEQPEEVEHMEELREFYRKYGSVTEEEAPSAGTQAAQEAATVERDTAPALAYMDDLGVVRCGECGAELLCSGTGDMLDVCPECGRRLEYDSFIEPDGPDADAYRTRADNQQGAGTAAEAASKGRETALGTPETMAGTDATEAAGGQQPPPQAGEINLGKLYAGTRLEATERDEGKQPGGP